MRARVGDLAIARFAPQDEDVKAGRKWNEQVCFVTGDGGLRSSYYTFVYWERKGQCFYILNSDLPRSRLVRARPKKKWSGTLGTLELTDVEPV